MEQFKKELFEKLDELKKAGSLIVRDREGREERGHKEGKDKEREAEDKKRSSDNKLGQFIDVLK